MVRVGRLLVAFFVLGSSSVCSGRRSGSFLPVHWTNWLYMTDDSEMANSENNGGSEFGRPNDGMALCV